MHHKNSHQDLLTAFVTAGLGAGIITSFAISQGQHPLVGIGITAFAAVAAIICDSFAEPLRGIASCHCEFFYQPRTGG
jgi:hypothetical protein